VVGTVGVTGTAEPEGEATGAARGAIVGCANAPETKVERMKAERRFMVDHQCDEMYEGFSWTGQQVQKVQTKCVPQFVRKNKIVFAR
jgi:hypothetical protein